MVPHVVVDSRLGKTFCENKRLFEFETEADMDEAVDVACAQSAKSSMYHRARADHDRYGKACH